MLMLSFQNLSDKSVRVHKQAEHSLYKLLIYVYTVTGID